MTNKISILLPAMLSFFALAGCSKLEEGEKLLTVTATSDTETKVVLGDDGLSTLWSEGDGFVAFDGTGTCAFSINSGAGTTKGSFSGKVSAAANSLYAAYPKTATMKSGHAYMNLGQSQTAVAGTFDSSAALMVAYSSDMKSVFFHHALAFVKIKPEFDCTSAILSTNDASMIAGKLDVAIGTDGLPAQCSVTSNGSSNITLSGPLEAGKTYLIGVLPGTWTKGISLELTTADGARYIRKSSGSAIFTRGKVYNLGSFRKDGQWDSIIVPAESVSLSRAAVGLVEGNTFDLTATITPSGAASSTVTWTTSDKSVATVSGGRITALKAGSCTITAKVDGLSATCSVSVIASSSSVFRFGYSQLSATEKAAYDIILSSILDFESNSKTYNDYVYNRRYLDFSSLGANITFNQVMRLASLITRDVPEAFHLNYIPRHDTDAGQFYLRLTNSFTPENYSDYLAEIYKQRDEILAEIPSGASEFEKAKAIHDSFLKRTKYGDVNGGNAGNIVGGLVNHRAVCEGYSRTYQFLCQQAGLNVIYISGSLQTSSENDTWVNHAWNHVMIGDNWYMCDTTSDGSLVGGTIGYRNFLLGKTSATSIHSYLNTSGGDPNCDQNGYSSLPELSATDYPMTR